MNSTELCWKTGNYTSDCICEFCKHKNECSGYENEDNYYGDNEEEEL